MHNCQQDLAVAGLSGRPGSLSRSRWRKSCHGLHQLFDIGVVHHQTIGCVDMFYRHAGAFGVPVLNSNMVARSHYINPQVIANMAEPEIGLTRVDHVQCVAVAGCDVVFNDGVLAVASMDDVAVVARATPSGRHCPSSHRGDDCCPGCQSIHCPDCCRRHEYPRSIT
jgi:hypothetical protein